MASTKWLLVEGTDDFHVILNLQGRLEFRALDQAEIIQMGSVSKLLESFPVRLKASTGGQRAGIVVDANGEIRSRWNAVRARLLAAGYPDVPNSPVSGGMVLNPPPGSLLPRFGVWVMPNNSTEGILEDFLRALIPAGDVLLPYAETCLAGLPEVRFPPQRRAKALLHTWLSWQEEPGKPFGQAMAAKYLDATNQDAAALADWLRLVFES